MKTQQPLFAAGFLSRLFDRFAEAPTAFEKLDALTDAFAEVAAAYYPVERKKCALKQLANQTKELSISFGYLMAIEKARIIGLIGHEKSFSFHNLDALYILRSISEFVANTCQVEIPYELTCVTERLHYNFNLSLSKVRLDSAISEYLIRNQKRQLKKIRVGILFLGLLTILNVVLVLGSYL